MKRIFFLCLLLSSCGAVKKQQHRHERASVVKEHLITDIQKQVQTAEIQQVKEISTFVGEEISITPTHETTAVIIEKERTATGEKIIVRGGAVKITHSEQTTQKTSEKTAQTQQKTQENQSVVKDEFHAQKQETSHKERKEWGRWRWLIFGLIVGAFVVLRYLQKKFR